MKREKAENKTGKRTTTKSNKNSTLYLILIICGSITGGIIICIIGFIIWKKCKSVSSEERIAIKKAVDTRKLELTNINPQIMTGNST